MSDDLYTLSFMAMVVMIGVKAGNPVDYALGVTIYISVIGYLQRWGK